MGDSKGDFDLKVEFNKEEINIMDGYVGRGYALSRPEEIEFIQHPVYIGKALYGLTSELKKGKLQNLGKVLFIHTGGLYGVFPVRELFKK